MLVILSGRKKRESESPLILNVGNGRRLFAFKPH